MAQKTVCRFPAASSLSTPVSPLSCPHSPVSPHPLPSRIPSTPVACQSLCQNSSSPRPCCSSSSSVILYTFSSSFPSCSSCLLSLALPPFPLPPLLCGSFFAPSPPFPFLSRPSCNSSPFHLSLCPLSTSFPRSSESFTTSSPEKEGAYRINLFRMPRGHILKINLYPLPHTSGKRQLEDAVSRDSHRGRHWQARIILAYIPFIGIRTRGDERLRGKLVDGRLVGVGEEHGGKGAQRVDRAQLRVEERHFLEEDGPDGGIVGLERRLDRELPQLLQTLALRLPLWKLPSSLHP